MEKETREQLNGMARILLNRKRKKGTDETRHEEYNDTAGTTVQRVMG